MKIGTILQNIFFTFLAKVRYGKRLQIDGIQGIIPSTQLHIENGFIRMGKYTHYKRMVSMSAVAGGNLTIGDHVFMNRNCIVMCRKSIEIGDNCAFGPNVVLYDHDHEFSWDGIQPSYRVGNIVIERNCWLGAGVTILRNTHIGEGCVIGAGTVVKGNIPPHSLVTSDCSIKIVPIEKR